MVSVILFKFFLFSSDKTFVFIITNICFINFEIFILACPDCNLTLVIDDSWETETFYWSTPNWGTGNYIDGCNCVLDITVSILSTHWSVIF